LSWDKAEQETFSASLTLGRLNKQTNQLLLLLTRKNLLPSTKPSRMRGQAKQQPRHRTSRLKVRRVGITPMKQTRR
jgi:hypothetical protein